MKLARPATLLTVGLMALSLGGIGCNKNPQKTTNIPGFGPGIVDDGRGKPFGEAPPFPGPNIPVPGPITQGDPTQGIKAAVGDWGMWTQDRREFQDQTVYFDFDKVAVKPSEVGKLREVARRMKTFRGKALYIEGHCDERGTEEYNRSLGDRRAQSIREFLVKEGLDPNMTPTISFGEDKPVDPGHNEAAWSKNRRGEMILLSQPGSN